MDQIISKLEKTTISTVSSLNIENNFVKNLNQVFSFHNNNVKVVGTIDKPWFRAKDVLKILGYSDNSNTLNTFIQKYIPDKYKQSYGNLVSEKVTYNESKEIYINKFGLERLISKSTKISNLNMKEKLIENFNLNINVMHQTIEQETLTPIKNILDEIYETIPQHKVDKYKIDLYVPKLKLAIECDEFNHRHYNQESEKEREDRITEELDCIFFRYNPCNKNFNLYKTIGELMKLIINIEKN